MPPQNEHISTRHWMFLSASVATEVALAFTVSSTLVNQLLLFGALLLVVGSILRIGDRQSASNALWAISMAILASSLLYPAMGWLFFHLMISIIMAAVLGLALGLGLIASGKGLIRLPD